MQPIISLVAEENGAIVGHILFTPVTLEGYPDLKMMGLGPMAVVPEHQCKGLGSALVWAGLKQCRQLGYATVIVLGPANYYPRFGFTSACRFGIESEYDVPEEVFMAMEMEPGALRGKSGVMEYRPAFGNI